MASYRRARINDAVREELSVALRDVKDPRVTDCMISITEAQVSPDLRDARIFYSVYGGDKAEAAKGLASATGYLRRVLAQKLNLRITPTLTFVEDDSMAHGAYISKLIMENAPADADDDEETEA